MVFAPSVLALAVGIAVAASAPGEEAGRPDAGAHSPYRSSGPKLKTWLDLPPEKVEREYDRPGEALTREENRDKLLDTYKRRAKRFEEAKKLEKTAAAEATRGSRARRTSSGPKRWWRRWGIILGLFFTADCFLIGYLLHKYGVVAHFYRVRQNRGKNM
jgi:hypothetical protein